MTGATVRKRRVLLGLIFVYMVLWLLTATWGNVTVNQKFDEQIALGYPGLSTTPVPVVRIPYTREMRDLGWSPPEEPWRARSRGVAIAPFLILDAAAWINGGLSGFSGFRLNLWFFGASSWIPLKVFWVS